MQGRLQIVATALALIAGLALAGASAAGVPTADAGSVGAVASPAASVPESGPGPRAVMQDAVAAVVVVALTEQFDGKSVSVNIDSYDVQVVGARERMVSGSGRVDVGGDAREAIGFRYRALYDALTDSAAYPSITVGGSHEGVERSVPNDATLVTELDGRVASQLSGQLGGKPVWLQLDRIESFESGDRYVRIEAEGLADFGVEGNAPARVEGLYDRLKAAWLRVHYELGSTGLAVERGHASASAPWTTR